MDDGQIGDLFLRYADEVSKFLVYWTRCRDVDDLLQETFIKALQAMRKMDPMANPRPWLMTIARNTAIDWQRKQRRQPRLDPAALTDLEAPVGSPEAHVEARELQRHLLEVLAGEKMRRGYREVVICRAVMDMSVCDVAQVLGWTENRVNVTYHRALRAVRTALEQEYGGWES